MPTSLSQLYPSHTSFPRTFHAPTHPQLTPVALNPSAAEQQEARTEHETRSRKKIKTIRVPPSRLLAAWLEESGQGHIVVNNHRSDRGKVPIPDCSSLQGILLQYLRQRHATDSQEALYHLSLPTFHRLGYSFGDLQKWSAILGVPSSGESRQGRLLAAARYLQSEEEIPFFLLLIILRSNKISRGNVRALLLHTWYRFLGYSHKTIISMICTDRSIPTSMNTPKFFPAGWHVHPWRIPLSASPAFYRLEENAFMVLISRLLAQARRAFPEALPSIACMFGHYLWFTRGTLELRADGSANVVDSKTHAKLSLLFNQAIKKLAIPTVAYPARDMKHAWTAQKSLIEQAGRYSPPLLLDQESYRATSRVVSASKKSLTECKFAKNMAPTWPPWREEQDGLDAERWIKDDLSRPALALRRMSEAGFHLDHLDWELLITGGRDSDGTPTIAQRHVSNRRSGKGYGEHRLWVARVRATRSAREAWMAFLASHDRTEPVALAIYSAVFEKLVSERLRLLRPQISEALPGESKEVIQHPFQNFTAGELARTEPMEEDLLYNHMIDSGLIPSGRFLDFLVRTAPSVATGIKYLQDADLHKRALDMMLDYSTFEMKDPRILQKKMPHSTSDAFIRLLCRFTYGHSHTEKDYLPSRRKGVHPPNLAGLNKFKSPLHYAIQLVRFYKPLFAPTWYSLFRALARPRVVIAAAFSGHPQDDLLSWVVLKQVLSDFHACKLELDLTGFHSICFCFEKAVFASRISTNAYTPLPTDMLQSISTNWKEEDLEMIKGEWKGMTESVVTPFNTPRLLHSFYHAAIHAYVRVLGTVRDWEEMVGVLKWMVEHKDQLDEVAMDYANGKRMRRRVLVAMRYFVDGALADSSEYETLSRKEEVSQTNENEDLIGDTLKSEDQAGGMEEDGQLQENSYANAILEKTEPEPETETAPHPEYSNPSANTFPDSDRVKTPPLTDTKAENQPRENLDKIEMQLRLLLEQNGLEHWGGWPLDVEVDRYARITRDERRIYQEEPERCAKG